MEATLTQVIAPMGCYSGPSCIGGIQCSTQSALREAGVRNKNLELRFADEFINESHLSEL